MGFTLAASTAVADGSHHHVSLTSLTEPGKSLVLSLSMTGPVELQRSRRLAVMSAIGNSSWHLLNLPARNTSNNSHWSCSSTALDSN